MQTTKGQVHDAMVALANIIRQPRMIPQIAKFKIAKMHSILEPQCTVIEAARAALIQQYGQEVFADDLKTISNGWQVEPGTPAWDAYLSGWDAIRAESLTVAVSPLMVQMLGNDPKGVEAAECKLLGDFLIDAEV